jgi:hypothetical protein
VLVFAEYRYVCHNYIVTLFTIGILNTAYNKEVLGYVTQQNLFLPNGEKNEKIVRISVGSGAGLDVARRLRACRHTRSPNGTPPNGSASHRDSAD